MKYISQPPLLLDVHIHKPLLPARTWMDSLLAFFPGLQVGFDHVKWSFCTLFFGLCHFTDVVHIVHVHASGLEGRHPSCHRDPWDVVSSYKETQLPPRGILSLCLTLCTILGFNCSAERNMMQFHHRVVSPHTACVASQRTSLHFTPHDCILASSLCFNYNAWIGVLIPSSFSVCPQAFTTDFRVHWAQHPLRPEFAESTYFLYKVIYQGSLTKTFSFQSHSTGFIVSYTFCSFLVTYVILLASHTLISSFWQYKDSFTIFQKQNLHSCIY